MQCVFSDCYGIKLETNNSKKKKKRICLSIWETQKCQFDLWVGKIPWKRACNPLQYSCLENPMDRGAWEASVHGVAKNWTQLKRLSTHAQALLYAHFTGEETETHEGKYKVTLTSLVIPVSSAPDCRETCVTEPNTLGLS